LQAAISAALSDNGNLQSCQKSQLATILETHVTPPDSEPEASFIILDGSALINALPSMITIFLRDYNCITSIRTHLYNFICQKVI
jgi:hypothetical protein